MVCFVIQVILDSFPRGMSGVLNFESKEARPEIEESPEPLLTFLRVDRWKLACRHPPSVPAGTASR
jgi:hypothetical protein